ncbi:MAG: YeeE/YedE thiosulfate transporter family protein, partial [Hyphomicrobium sp.]
MIWLPAQLGYSRWLALQFLVLAALAGLIGWYGRLPQAQPLLPTTTPVHHALHKIFIERWPASVGGAAVGVLATVAYFQVKPLGVTAAVGGYARTLLASAGQLPQTLHGLDGFAGCRTSIDTLLTPNAVFVLGLIAASFSSALIAGQFQPALPAPRQIVKGLGGGVLLGWGAMTALGCTVGTLLSGTM